MSVVIRLARTGRRNLPFYRLTVADSRRWRDGKFIAKVGWYDPTKNEVDKRYEFDLDAIDSWIKKGAQLTETVKKLVQDYRKAKKQ